MKYREQDSTDYPIGFLMVSSADHLTGQTGLTPAVTIAKNGAAFAAAEGTVTEVGSGWYVLEGDADDRDTLGELLIHAEATGADPVDERCLIVPWDLMAIEAKTALIATGTVNVVAATHTDGTSGPLVSGDDYVAGTANALYVTTDVDLSGCTVVCNFGDVVEGVACTVTGPASGVYTVTIPHLTAVQTAMLVGICQREFEATDSSGNKTTFGRSSVKFLPDAPS